MQHFYAEPRAAQTKLGWRATTNLPEDLKERFEEYMKIGRDKKPMQFELDDKILEALKVPVPVWSMYILKMYKHWLGEVY